MFTEQARTELALMEETSIPIRVEAELNRVTSIKFSQGGQSSNSEAMTQNSSLSIYKSLLRTEFLQEGCSGTGQALQFGSFALLQKVGL